MIVLLGLLVVALLLCPAVFLWHRRQMRRANPAAYVAIPVPALLDLGDVVAYLPTDYEGLVL